MNLPTEDDPVSQVRTWSGRKPESNRTWLFGEAEWDSNESFDQNKSRLFDVAEACGYMIDSNNKDIIMQGNDGERIKITIEFSQARGSFIKGMKAQFNDEGIAIENWHEIRLGFYP